MTTMKHTTIQLLPLFAGMLLAGCNDKGATGTFRADLTPAEAQAPMAEQLGSE